MPHKKRKINKGYGLYQIVRGSKIRVQWGQTKEDVKASLRYIRKKERATFKPEWIKKHRKYKIIKER